VKSITVLKLKLVDADDLLRPIGETCRRARNAGLENWLLRQRGFPESRKQSERLIASKNGDKPKAESTKIYHSITAAVPELGTTQVTMLAQAIASHLSAKVDWRRGTGENGKRPKRRDAILAYEDRPPFFTTLEIPVHNAHCRISFSDRLTITLNRPLREVQSVTLEVSLRKLPPSIQSIIRDMGTGKRKLPDSKLVEKDGTWYWHIPVTFETGIRSDLTAELWPTIGSEKDGRQTDRPFRLELPNRDRPWWIGDGRYLKAQTERLIGLRKMIGWRYRQRMGAGHGRAKVDAAVRRRRTQERNVRTEVLRRAIADIVRQCVQSNAGILVYHEPSLPLREKCWFAANGLDWDWTKFGADLKNAAARQGIEVIVKQWKVKDAIPKKETVST
jgi:hypothetical protein